MADEDLKPTGYVVDALEVALWGFYHFDSYEEGLLAVVNLGGDADKTGAIYGQLAGAYYGVGGIPGALVDGLARCELIKTVATGLTS